MSNQLRHGQYEYNDAKEKEVNAMVPRNAAASGCVGLVERSTFGVEYDLLSASRSVQGSVEGTLRSE